MPQVRIYIQEEIKKNKQIYLEKENTLLKKRNEKKK